MADLTADSSAFLCAMLPLAMRRRERLTVRGPISPSLSGRVEEIQTIYRSWDPGMVRIEVHADQCAFQPTGTTRAAFFSRGVDSMFTAARVVPVGWNAH